MRTMRALLPFFVLYAENSLGLSVAVAGALPLAFGALTALGMVLAGRARFWAPLAVSPAGQGGGIEPEIWRYV